MFGVFKKKSPLEELQKKHKKLLKEAFRLSTVDRIASEAKVAEAKEVEDQIMAFAAKR